MLSNLPLLIKKKGQHGLMAHLDILWFAFVHNEDVVLVRILHRLQHSHLVDALFGQPGGHE